MEKPSNPERRIEKGEVFEKLKTKGSKDKDAHKLFSDWVKQEEALAKKDGSLKAVLLFQLEKIDVRIIDKDFVEKERSLKDKDIVSMEQALSMVLHYLSNDWRLDEKDIEEVEEKLAQIRARIDAMKNK